LGGIYHKIHLVPFGEYVPLRKIVPFFKWLTPITDSFECGREFTLFQLNELRFGVVICFEDTVPEVYRYFIRSGADFMVNLTNDAWFKDSPAAEMHLANAVFRCAETRRPLVRCTNNGVTCVVDEFGFVRSNMRLTPFADGSLVCTLLVPHNPGMTFYAEHGDWIVGVCAIVAALTVAFNLPRKRHGERAS
jgi:apolipoprotein N-acyltransferase